MSLTSRMCRLSQNKKHQMWAGYNLTVHGVTSEVGVPSTHFVSILIFCLQFHTCLSTKWCTHYFCVCSFVLHTMTADGLVPCITTGSLHHHRFLASPGHQQLSYCIRLARAHFNINQTSFSKISWSLKALNEIDNLTHWGWDKMAAILQMTFSDAFSWTKVV